MQKWMFLLRAHDHVWRDRRWPLSVRMQTCQLLIRKMLEIGTLTNGEHPDAFTEKGWKTEKLTGTVL